MELSEYIKIQEQYIKSNPKVRDQLWLERLKVPHDLSEFPDFPVRPDNISDSDYLVITEEYWAKRKKKIQKERIGFKIKPKKPRNKKTKNQKGQENCDLSENKESEEILNVVEELPFDSFFPEDNFENTSDESERMCNLNTPSSKNEDCDYSFSQNDDLKTHTESAHEEKKVFNCKICESCTQTDNMKTHLLISSKKHL